MCKTLLVVVVVDVDAVVDVAAVVVVAAAVVAVVASSIKKKTGERCDGNIK